MPRVNVDALNLHLAEIAEQVTEGAHAVLVLDQAGWHTSPRLCVPENISLLSLPPYAPELNLVENVWAYLPRQLSEPPRLGQLRGYRRGLLRCLEQVDDHARASRLHHPSRLGQSGQRMRQLVLSRSLMLMASLHSREFVIWLRQRVTDDCLLFSIVGSEQDSGHLLAITIHAHPGA